MKIEIVFGVIYFWYPYLLRLCIEAWNSKLGYGLELGSLTTLKIRSWIDFNALRKWFLTLKGIQINSMGKFLFEGPQRCRIRKCRNYSKLIFSGKFRIMSRIVILLLWSFVYPCEAVGTIASNCNKWGNISWFWSMVNHFLFCQNCPTLMTRWSGICQLFISLTTISMIWLVVIFMALVMVWSCGL